jgi:hypothetical protein
LNFSGRIIPSIASRVLDACERDRAVIVDDKAVNAVRRLECDVQGFFGHDGVKVASNWVPYLIDARYCTSSAPEEDLPNSVSQEVSLLIAVRRIAEAVIRSVGLIVQPDAHATT